MIITVSYVVENQTAFELNSYKSYVVYVWLRIISVT